MKGKILEILNFLGTRISLLRGKTCFSSLYCIVQKKRNSPSKLLWIFEKTQCLGVLLQLFTVLSGAWTKKWLLQQVWFEYKLLYYLGFMISRPIVIGSVWIGQICCLNLPKVCSKTWFIFSQMSIKSCVLIDQMNIIDMHSKIAIYSGNGIYEIRF